MANEVLHPEWDNVLADVRKIRTLSEKEDQLGQLPEPEEISLQDVLTGTPRAERALQLSEIAVPFAQGKLFWKAQAVLRPEEARRQAAVILAKVNAARDASKVNQQQRAVIEQKKERILDRLDALAREQGLRVKIKGGIAVAVHASGFRRTTAKSVARDILGLPEERHDAVERVAYEVQQEIQQTYDKLSASAERNKPRKVKRKASRSLS